MGQLIKYTGHLVEGHRWTTEKPNVPGLWAARKCANDPMIAWIIDHYSQWEIDHDMARDGLEWCLLLLPTDAPDQAYYKAEEVGTLHTELVRWFQDFIEWNACNEKDGKYACNQCDVPSEKGHAEDCEIIEAKVIIDRLRGGA